MNTNEMQLPTEITLLSTEEQRELDGGAWLPAAVMTTLKVAAVVGGVGAGLLVVGIGVGLAIAYYSQD